MQLQSHPVRFVCPACKSGCCHAEPCKLTQGRVQALPAHACNQLMHQADLLLLHFPQANLVGRLRPPAADAPGPGEYQVQHCAQDPHTRTARLRRPTSALAATWRARGKQPPPAAGMQWRPSPARPQTSGAGREAAGECRAQQRPCSARSAACAGRSGSSGVDRSSSGAARSVSGITRSLSLSSSSSAAASMARGEPPGTRAEQQLTGKAGAQALVAGKTAGGGAPPHAGAAGKASGGMAAGSLAISAAALQVTRAHGMASSWHDAIEEQHSTAHEPPAAIERDYFHEGFDSLTRPAAKGTGCRWGRRKVAG